MENTKCHGAQLKFLDERMRHKRQRIEAAVRLEERRPYLRYVAVEDARTSAEHMAFHSIVLPLTHPFWNRHLPPFEEECRCMTMTLSARDMVRFGYAMTTSLPEGLVTADDEKEWPLKLQKLRLTGL